jgi:heme-degrading monooxygenase HmoA
MPIATTPKPPYIAVIFTSQRAGEDNEYAATARRMEELAREQPGYLGIESARGADGFGITVSYWTTMEAVKNWKAVAEHMVAQRRGRDEWYRSYRTRVCTVEREYGFES